MSEEVTQKELMELLNYDLCSGQFFWRSTGSGRRKGLIAGHIKKYESGKSYLLIKIKGRLFRAHRLAWLYVYGYEPECIDHIDGNGLNNSINNLRDIALPENGKNQRLFSTNTSGVTGVYWMKANQKWHAKIVINRKSIHLGYFDDKDDAIRARKSAEIEHSFHPNHGSKRSL